MSTAELAHTARNSIVFNIFIASEPSPLYRDACSQPRLLDLLNLCGSVPTEDKRIVDAIIRTGLLTLGNV
jgi:hypothetical protein